MPLDPDDLFWAVYQLPTVFTGFTGTLSSIGSGQAAIHVPPDPSLHGITFVTAGVAHDGLNILAISGGVRLTIP